MYYNGRFVVDDFVLLHVIGAAIVILIFGLTVRRYRNKSTENDEMLAMYREQSAEKNQEIQKKGVEINALEKNAEDQREEIENNNLVMSELRQTMGLVLHLPRLGAVIGVDYCLDNLSEECILVHGLDGIDLSARKIQIFYNGEEEKTKVLAFNPWSKFTQAKLSPEDSAKELVDFIRLLAKQTLEEAAENKKAAEDK
ncbi:MAG: hypothetical protein MUD10_03205 [Candidatus Pacebacteria bacterium]|jgi:hypothetical protein|nr:hypothetical protein [Candidatus Paceibacterota bacterium]